MIFKTVTFWLKISYIQLPQGVVDGDKKPIKLTLPTSYKSKVIFFQLPYLANLKDPIFQASLTDILKNREGLQKFFFSYRWFNPIQDEGRGEGGCRAKQPPTSFPPVTSTNVGTSPQNFLTFSFNHYANWCKISHV